MEQVHEWWNKGYANTVASHQQFFDKYQLALVALSSISDKNKGDINGEIMKNGEISNKRGDVKKILDWKELILDFGIKGRIHFFWTRWFHDKVFFPSNVKVGDCWSLSLCCRLVSKHLVIY